jgi:hypothetical protein
MPLHPTPRPIARVLPREKLSPPTGAGFDGRMACHPFCSASGARLGASPGINVESVSIASALARYSWDIAIRRVETSSEEEARDRRRQTSACRRKYSALGTGTPLSHARNSQDDCTVPDKRRTFQKLSPRPGRASWADGRKLPGLARGGPGLSHAAPTARQAERVTPG